MKKYVPEILLVLLELGLLVMQFVETIRTVLFKDPASAFGSIAVTQILIMALYLAAKGIQNSITLTDISHVAHDLTRKYSRVDALHEDDFYMQFYDQLKAARKAVSMAHLDVKPPQQQPDTPSSTYYKNLPKMIRQNKAVRFQRVEVVSKEKREWIQSLVKSLQGQKNFSLACLDFTGNPERGPYVSVQLVDDEFTYLVAVAQHYRPDRKRDILICDRDVNDIWRQYYDRVLWGNAIKVIENGSLNKENWNKVQDIMGD